MKIRAKASPSFVFDAHPDAAKELIEGGVYEAVDEKEEKKTAVKPLGTEDFPEAPKAKVPAKGRGKK